MKLKLKFLTQTINCLDGTSHNLKSVRHHFNIYKIRMELKMTKLSGFKMKEPISLKNEMTI
jgi:hypothetical protein